MIMKRLLVCLASLALLVPLWGQGRVSTRKYIVSDFTDKITQVVLTGNDVMDSALRTEISNNWTASAFEFCTLEKFEQLKSNNQYYFLLPAESRFKGEENPGILFLSLIKGGPDAAKGIDEMTDIISLPLCAAMGGSGRELIYLGAVIKAIQEFTLAAMESEKVAYGRTLWFNENYAKFGKMKQIYLAREDLAESVTDKDLERYLDTDIFLVDESKVDEVFLRGDYNTLVSYTVAPVMPEEGSSYCYNMLFEADTHTLYYIHRHKITKKFGEGFLVEDLKRMARKR